MTTRDAPSFSASFAPRAFVRRAIIVGLSLTVSSGLANEPVSVPAARAPIASARDLLRSLGRRPVIVPPSTPIAPSFRWNALDTAALVAQDAIRDRTPGLPSRTGVNRAVPAAPLSVATDGEWLTEPGGARVWRLSLEDPGAVAVRLNFSRFDLPHGAVVAVYGNRGVGDVYRESGPLHRGDFWAAATPGDTVYVEYRDPTGAARDPVIEINEISHIYRGGIGMGGDDAANGGGGVASALLPCQVDVNCEVVDPVARDSVGRMEFTIPGDGTYKCTGALLNDADTNTFAGYFLTARHCIDDQIAADALTVYWFYQTSVCNGAAPDPFSLPRSFGAVYLGGSGEADSTLLRLLDDPRDGQAFAAWTTDAPAIGSVVTAIHHPDGTFKRIAAGPVTTDAPICTELPLVNYLYNDWTPGDGITEGGSSGAPLFNENWEVVGQLFGTCSTQTPGCANPLGYNAVAGRFSKTYPTISSLLNTITPDDALEDNDDLASAPTVSEGIHELVLADLDDFVRVALTESRNLSASVTFDPDVMDVTLSLVHPTGPVIVAADAVSGSAEVSADLLPGEYLVGVSKSGGWGGDYTLDIQTDVSTCTVASAPSPEPDPQPKNRYISFVAGDESGTETAIGVRMIALNHPVGGGSGGLPNFSQFDGDLRFVGPPQLVNDPTGVPSSYYVAELQCTPFVTDWAPFGLIHVNGREVVPGSTYEVAHAHPDCTLTNPGNYSEAVVVSTRVWGDVVAPFGPTPGQPNFIDIRAIVDRFSNNSNAVMKLRAQLQPDPPNPAATVSFVDINLGVTAFQGAHYPYAGPQSCP